MNYRMSTVENSHLVKEDEFLNFEKQSSSSLSSSSSSSHHSFSSTERARTPTIEKSSNQMNNTSSESNRTKDATIKLPYPVLSDHRDPASVLILLQKETQATSKKIIDVNQQIETCEKRLLSTSSSEQEKKTLKYERVKCKQQLDALKKHERRVNLQIDFMTTKTEIKGLEDEQKQNENDDNQEQTQQIEILLRKLKQKLDKMKIYMRARNEQMRKTINGKNKSSNQSAQELTRSTSQNQVCKRTAFFHRSKMIFGFFYFLFLLLKNCKRSTVTNNGISSNKRLKSVHPTLHLSSRLTHQNSKNHSNRIAPPIVRFLNKTTDSMTNSASPTTPASSSSTLSSPLAVSTSAGESIRRSISEVKTLS